jgi:hypothetical protein
MALLAGSCANSGGTDPPTTAAVAAPVTTAGVAVVYEDGQPGSCRVLEEKYCSLGEAAYFENGTPYVAFSLPQGTPLFAFRDGDAYEINVAPAGPGNHNPDESYRAVHIMSTSSEGTRHALALFMDTSGEPDVHLTSVEEGDLIGYLTAEPLPVLPSGLRDTRYNLLIELLDLMDEPDNAAFEEYFGLTP